MNTNIKMTPNNLWQEIWLAASKKNYWEVTKKMGSMKVWGASKVYRREAGVKIISAVFILRKKLLINWWKEIERMLTARNAQFLWSLKATKCSSWFLFGHRLVKTHIDRAGSISSKIFFSISIDYSQWQTKPATIFHLSETSLNPDSSNKNKS